MRARTELRDYHGYDVDAVVVVEQFDPIDIDITVEELTIRCRDDGPPISSEGIRKVAVQSIVNDAVREAVRASAFGQAIPEGEEAVGLGMLLRSEAERLGNAGPTPETIEWVGRIYLLADLVGDAPTKAVEKTFDVSRSTAGAWIGRARAAGHIPPVRQVSQKAMQAASYRVYYDTQMEFAEEELRGLKDRVTEAEDNLRRAQKDGTPEEIAQANEWLGVATARLGTSQRLHDDWLRKNPSPDA